MANLKVGDAAPDFEIPGDKEGKKLSDYRGKVTVVYFSHRTPLFPSP